jgi:hypothetical protein
MGNDSDRPAEENREPPGGDYRLWPGGAHGTPVDPGMSSLDHDHDPHPEAAGWIDEQIVGKREGVKR